MKQTILRNMIILTLVAVIISSAVSVFVVHDLHLDYTDSDLRNNADFIIGMLDESYTLDEFIQLNTIANSNTRITIIAPSGDVLYDNRADELLMANHREREEVATAFELGEGESRRLSSTLGTNTLYYAVLLDDGNVIRF